MLRHFLSVADSDRNAAVLRGLARHDIDCWALTASRILAIRPKALETLPAHADYHALSRVVTQNPNILRCLDMSERARDAARMWGNDPVRTLHVLLVAPNVRFGARGSIKR